MSFMLALPKISLHGAGAIGDMVKLVAGKQWGKALIVTDGQLVKLGLLDSLFAALDEQQMAYQRWCSKAMRLTRRPAAIT